MKNDIDILVVDDDIAMQSLLGKILRNEGYRTSMAKNGDEAMKILRNQKIDLVLTDIRMPNMNGFELLKAIKAEMPQIGVIIMTGFGDAFTVKDALVLGADEYITKPFKVHEISLVLERTSLRRNLNSSDSG